MKNIFYTVSSTLLAFVFLFLFLGMAQAHQVVSNLCISAEAGPLPSDFLQNNKGFVPCGRGDPIVEGKNFCECEIGHLFLMGYKIYLFALTIITLVAALMIVIGGILWMTSGGMPGLHQTAKNMIVYALVGVIIMFSSWLIINTIFIALGYKEYTWILPGV